MINQIVNKIRKINNVFELVIVTKNQDVDEICKIYSSGELNFAENKSTRNYFKKEKLPPKHQMAHDWSFTNK